MSFPHISGFDGPTTILRQNSAHPTLRLRWAAQTIFLWGDQLTLKPHCIERRLDNIWWSSKFQLELESNIEGQPQQLRFWSNTQILLKQILLKLRKNTLNIVTHHVVWCNSVFLWSGNLLEYPVCFISTWVPISQLSSQLHQNFEVGAHKSKVKMHTNPKSKWAQIRLTENVYMHKSEYGFWMLNVDEKKATFQDARQLHIDWASHWNSMHH